MYISGQGSGKQRRATLGAPNGCSSTKHTIKDRKKEIKNFTAQQIKDAVLAAGVVLGLQLFTTYFAFNMAGAVITGMTVFAAKKLINAGVRFGKKHLIKKRTKKMKASDVVKTTIKAAATITPMLLFDFAPASIAASGLGAIFWLTRHHLKNKQNTDSSQRVR